MRNRIFNAIAAPCNAAFSYQLSAFSRRLSATKELIADS
jgi:hypothetical protein